METGSIIFTAYWTALPEALRDVIGDPFGRPAQ